MSRLPPSRRTPGALLLDRPSARVPSPAPSWNEATVVEYVAGVRLGDRYTLVQPLGQGGMGAVWLAHDEVEGGEVAVKLLAPGGGPDAAARLLQEAGAAARLGHPSIVRVLDVGVAPSGEPFLVMVRLRGESLRTLLTRRGRLPATQAVQVVLPIASALVAAHAAGIVHRDLKPDNIVIAQTDEGTTLPTLVDFGVAKLRVGDELQRVITVKGLSVGSPDYMAPEQVRSPVDVDERADVWSLCVLLYEAVTGQRPFAGPSYVALLNAIVSSAPAPITQFAAGDAALWAILERGLSKAPAARHATMFELGLALARWAAAHGVERDVTGDSIALAWLGAVSAPPAPGSSRSPTLPGAPRPLLSDITGAFPSSPSEPPPSLSIPPAASIATSPPSPPAFFTPFTICVLGLCAIVGLALGALLPRLAASPRRESGATPLAPPSPSAAPRAP
jgi:eukaryotic-like serine/threonine-protein kinase